MPYNYELFVLRIELFQSTPIPWFNSQIIMLNNCTVTYLLSHKPSK